MRRLFLTLAVASGATVLSVGAATAGATQSTRPAVSPPSSASILPGQGAVPLPSFEGEQLRQRADAVELRAAATKYRGRVAAADVRSIVDGIAPSLTSRDGLVPKASEVSRVLGPRAAQLRGADGKPGGAAVFGMPIAVPASADADAKWELVDLDWQTGGSRLAVERPAVPVSLPAAGSGQVRVGDLAARLAPAGATGSTASVESESVVYPNVATDTDLVVRSLSVGVQVGWVLRSPEADEAIRVPLELPTGLSARLDGQGGVRIVDSAGRLAGSWSAATAVDAGGFPVPLETSLDGTTVVIRVSHRAAETQYPVVVDPYFEAGGTAATSDFNAWVFAKSDPSSSFHTNELTPPAARTSLFVGSGNGVSGWSTVLLENGAWGRPAPGDQTIGSPGAHGRNVSPEHAYWTDGTFSDVTVTTDELLRLPELFHRPKASLGFGLGIRYANFGGTHTPSGSSVQQYGPWIMTMGNGSGLAASVQASASVKQPGNWAVAGLYVNGKGDYPQPPATAITNPDDYGTLDMQSYRLNAADNVAPTVTANMADGPLGSSAEWEAAPDPLRIVSSDRGLGISRTVLQLIQAPGQMPLAGLVTETCPAQGNMLCPFDATAEFSFDEVPEGRGYYLAKAVDAGGRETALGFPKAIDRSAPEIELSGDLHALQDTEAPAGSQRPLEIYASDGDPNAPLNSFGLGAGRRSGVQRIEVYVDDELVHEEEQTVAGDNRELWTTWTPDTDTFTSGEYTVEVVATDRLGQESSETFTVKAPCCSEELDEGSVTIGDRLHAFGDLDGDGVVDVALVDEVTGNVTVARGNGDGTFATQTSWGTFGTAVDKVAAGNVDGNDETAEAESTDDLVARAVDGTVLLRLSDGETLVVPDTTGLTDLQATWPADRSLELADVDGDGLADLAGMLTSTRQVRVAVSLGAAFESSSSWATVPTGVQAPLGDLNGDGMADLVIYDPATGDVDFRRSTSIGFEPVEAWGTGPAAAEIAIGDLDVNGLADAVFRVGSGAVSGRISSRDEGFTAGTVALGSLAASFDLHVRDVTGDGRDDVLGARVQSGVLETRSASSTLRDSEAADSTADDPDLPDEDGPGTLGARLAAKASAPPPKATLMMSDDNALKYGSNLGGRTRSELLQQMKYLGAEKVRTVAWWGQVDRLHPADESSLVSAVDPPQAPITGQDRDVYPPASQPQPRVMRLARDATDLPATQAVDDPRAEWIENPAPGQPGHNPNLAAGGEWVIVRDRFYVTTLDTVLSTVASEGMTAHVTISGGTGGFTRCSGGDGGVGADLQVRGCRPGDQTGERPSPKRAGHAIASIAEVLRVRHGSMVESVGVWNEPNHDRATFLSREATKKKKGEAKQLNRAPLYGEIYAYAYQQMSARDMLSGSSKRVKLAFGELTSKATKNNGNTTSDKSLTPERWVEQAVAAAEDAAGVSWPGGIVRADIFAVHPYQPARSNSKTANDRPWQVNRSYPWGVRGVSASVRRKDDSVEIRSVKAYLSRAAGASTPKLRRVAASHATAPHIWATEFGYFTSKQGEILYNNETLSHAHPEPQRANYMTRTKTRSTKYGALPGLSRQGGVKVIGLWEVLEDPPASVLRRAEAKDDYGFIGSGETHSNPTLGWGGTSPSAPYLAPIFQVNSSTVRPYGPPARVKPKEKRVARHDTLQWPRARRLACAIRSWAATGAPPIPGATLEQTCG